MLEAPGGLTGELIALLRGGLDGDAALRHLDLSAARGVGDALHLGDGDGVAVLGGGLRLDGDELLGGLRFFGRCGFPFRIFRRTFGGLFLDVLLGHASLLGIGLQTVEVPHQGFLIDGAVLVQEVCVAQDQLEVGLDVVAVALELGECHEQLVDGLPDLVHVLAGGLLDLLDGVELSLMLGGGRVGLLLEGLVLVALLFGLDVVALGLLILVLLGGLIGQGGVVQQDVFGAGLALLVLLGGVGGGVVLRLFLGLCSLGGGRGQLIGLLLGGQGVLVLDLHSGVEFEGALVGLGEALADLTDHLFGGLGGFLGGGDVLRGGHLGKFGDHDGVGGVLALRLVLGVGGPVSHQVGKSGPDECGRHDGCSHCCHREIATVFHGSSSLVPHWVQRSRMGWHLARTPRLGDLSDGMGIAS